MNVGFIGPGIMGRPMAANPPRGGHALHLYSHGGVPDELLQAGGTACGSGREAAERAEVVVTMLPDTPHVEAVLFGRSGVAEGLSPGEAVVDMSSIASVAPKGFARRVNDLGCDDLDASVSGGEVGAEAARLTIMAGGPQAAFDRVRPPFEPMGKNITLVGGDGDGQTTKVADRIIVALTIEAGADPARVRQAPMGGFANSRVSEVHGERMIQRSFGPGFRIEPHHKDLSLPLSGARALGLSLPNTATCQELFNACVARGGGAWDHSALVRALEMLANHEVARTGERPDGGA